MDKDFELIIKESKNFYTISETIDYLYKNKMFATKNSKDYIYKIFCKKIGKSKVFLKKEINEDNWEHDYNLILKESNNFTSVKDTVEFLHKENRFKNKCSISRVCCMFSYNADKTNLLLKRAKPHRQREIELTLKELKTNNKTLCQTISSLYKQKKVGIGIKEQSFFVAVISSLEWASFKDEYKQQLKEKKRFKKSNNPHLLKYQKIVDEFEENNYEGKIMTNEVKQAYQILKEGIKIQIKRTFNPPDLSKYQKIVDEFEENNYEGKIMTNEVKQAYKKLKKC